MGRAHSALSAPSPQPEFGCQTTSQLTLEGIITNTGKKAATVLLNTYKLVEEKRTTYGDRTPTEEKHRIERVELDELRKQQAKRPGQEWPKPPTEEDGMKLARGIEDGKVKAYNYEDAKLDAQGRVVPGTGFASLATAGLAPTDRADFAVVSAPGSDPNRFSEAVWLCARYGVGLAVVFEVDWGDVWFLLWKQNVARMVRAGKRLVVLTDQHGQVGFAQTMEIFHLRELGCSFKAMKIDTFLKQMNPLNYAAANGDDLAPLLLAPPTPGAPPLLEGRGTTGNTALHEAVLKQRPAAALRALRDAGLDVDAQTFAMGSTPLIVAAENGYCDHIRALLALRADPAIRMKGGFTALEVAEYWEKRGRACCGDAARVLRQGP